MIHQRSGRIIHRYERGKFLSKANVAQDLLHILVSVELPQDQPHAGKKSHKTVTLDVQLCITLSVTYRPTRINTDQLRDSWIGLENSHMIEFSNICSFDNKWEPSSDVGISSKGCA